MVGLVAHTFHVYGRMKQSAIPWPRLHRIHSSKVLGFGAVLASAAASMRPLRHVTWSSTDRADRLFWKGYGTQRFL